MKKFAIFIWLILIWPITFLHAAEFNQNFIITDEEITDSKSMTLTEIDEFLQLKNSFLKYYYPPDYDGVVRTVPEIIWLASLRYNINPKYTLVLLQKEQSLIEDSLPNQRGLDWATGYGVCDSCATTDPTIQKYKGFGKQIDNGVGFMRFFLDNPEKSEPFLIGQSVTVADKNNNLTQNYEIEPVNQSTANLYKYTPHYHGNYNFWKIWQRYFSQDYPDGTLVKLTDNPDVWVIQNGQKRQFKSFAILLSRYNPDKIVTITKTDLDKFETGQPINFPQYSYLRSPSGTVYLIIGDYRHGFASADALRLLGINPEEIVDVTLVDLDTYQESTPIDINSAYPTGALLQNKETGGVYYVENGLKAPIWSREIMQTVFPKKKIISVTADELNKYPDTSPIYFNNGDLIKSNAANTVYVIENNLRRPIVDEKTFNRLGYNWHNIVTTNDQAVYLHPEGPALK